MITTLLTRNDKGKVVFVLIDMKGGVELSQFKDAPNLLMPIIRDKKHVKPTLERVLKEVKRRLFVFERMGVVNIQTCNQRHHPMMAYWVLVIDELAHLMLDPSLKKDSEILLADIAALSRAAGIHVIAATQRPSVDVVTGLIKANFPVRLAFSTASQADSRVIIDTGDACQLAPQGRMIFFMGNTKVELQGPFISPTLIDETMTQIIGGKREEALDARKRHNVTSIDLMRHALPELGGRAPIAKLFNDFKAHNIKRREIEQMLVELENTEFEINGKWFKLTPPTPGPGALLNSRCLVPIETTETVFVDDHPNTEYNETDTELATNETSNLSSEISEPDKTRNHDDGKNGSHLAEEDPEMEHNANEFSGNKILG